MRPLVQRKGVDHETDHPFSCYRSPRPALVPGDASGLSASLRSTSALAQAQRDPLPSWNDGATKASILDFVARVTTQGGPDFVPVDQRIATFDNDGTLWVEQPMYVQLAFALDRVKVHGAACIRNGRPSSRSRRCWTAT